MMALVRMLCGDCARVWVATPLSARNGCPFCGSAQTTRKGPA